MDAARLAAFIQAATPGPDGSIDLLRLGRALCGLEGLYTVPDQGTLLDSLSSGPRTPDEVSGPTFFPREMNVATARLRDGGKATCLFSSEDVARKFAEENGFLEPGAVAMFMGGSVLGHLRGSLGQCDGVLLDPGSTHMVYLDRSGIRTVLSVMEDGESADALAEGAAVAGEVDEDALAAGLSTLFGESSEPASPDPASPAAGTAAPDTLRSPRIARSLPDPRETAAGGIPAVRRLRERGGRTPDPVPPPGRPDLHAEARARELHQAWKEERQPSWEVLDLVAFDLDLYVPVDPETSFGLRWPMPGTHPTREGEKAIHAFASRTTAEKLLGARGPLPEIVHLSGIEALRWMWAAPIPASAYCLHYDDQLHHIEIKSEWALFALFPHFHGIEDPDRIGRMAPARLGGRPQARGTEALCIRSLADGWKGLVGVKGADGGPGPPLEHDGGRYLPVFSGPERYFDFDTAHPEASGAPAPAGEDPPFRGWLHQVFQTGVEGVLLDAGSANALPIDRTALVLLALASGTGRRPEGTDLVVGLQSLGDLASPEEKARILADWPGFYSLVREGAEGRPELMTLPDRECLAAFTTRDKVESYERQLTPYGVDPTAWAPYMNLSGWVMNVFDLAADHFAEGLHVNPRALNQVTVFDPGIAAAQDFIDAVGNLDPDHADGDGMPVTPEMARAAVERLDETLTPRLEGFYAEG